MSNFMLDMTKGKEISHLVKFSVPMLVGNLFQQLYSIVNSIVVGKHIGDTALAAVGIVATLTSLFFSICMGLAIGIGVVASHYFGANRKEEVQRTIGNSVYLLGLIAVLMSIIGVFFANPILTFMKTPAEVMPYALPYMRVLSAGTIFVAGYNGIASILRSLGDAKTPLIFLVISNIINVILDIILVIHLDMGVVGAAGATVFSQGFSMVGSILFAIRVNPYLRLKKEHFSLQKNIFMQSAKIGIPVGLQSGLIASSMIALQSVVNGFGTEVMAAFTATNRVEQVISQPYNSIGTAVATFTGQNLGSGNVKRIRSGYMKSVWIVTIYSLFAIMVIFAASEWIMGAFISNQDTILMASRALRITALFYIPLSYIYVVRGVLNGVGDGVFAMIHGFFEVAGRIGFSLVFMYIAGVGVWGIWYTMGLTWASTALLGFCRYKQGKWKKSLVLATK